jgi:two-component system chemotaxis response regulator CheY
MRATIGSAGARSAPWSAYATAVAVVLVVDDLPLIRLLCLRYLEAAGHEVIQATNGVEAVHAYNVSRPNAVLLDLKMPELDGLGALKAIMVIDPQARVAMFTSAADTKQVTSALQLGARDYVVKPFRVERLLQAVDRLLE